MQTLKIYPWLDNQWRQLISYNQQKRIPQALIIHGSPGVGKLCLAESFAQCLLCESPATVDSACGECRACHLFKAGSHPDYLFLEPEEPGKAIGIDKIRQLIVQLALKPQFERQRLVVINDADSLNTAATNAFLKCLEEPTERTSIILILKKMAKLPATIRSRCHIMAVGQPDGVQAMDWLKAQQIDDGARLLQMAQGAPLLAKQYAERGLLAKYDAYFNDWLRVAQGKIDVIQLAEEWHQQDAIALTDVLSWMVQWVAGLIKSTYLSDCKAEHIYGLQELAETLDLKEVYRFYDLLLDSIKNKDTQLNKQLLIENVLIEWSKLNKR